MNDYYNPYNRIHLYWSYFSHLEDAEAKTIAGLMQISAIPLSTIREDMVNILAGSTEPFIAPDTDSDGYLILSQQNDFTEDDWYERPFPDSLRNRLLSGALDHLPFSRNQAQEELPLTLTVEEYKALQYLFAATTSTNKPDFTEHYPLLIKDSYRFHTNTIASTRNRTDFIKFLEMVDSALLYGSCLHMEYASPQYRKPLVLDIKPLKLVYDAIDNIYAILTIGPDPIHPTSKDGVMVYRIDRILSLQETKKKITISDTSLLDIAPNVWGMQFNATPHRVKVRFYNEGNVFHKVRMDLSYRTNGRLYEADGYLYYEDTVYGISSFQRWIRGFGSSAIVIEPISLRREIIASLKERQGQPD